MNKNKLTSYFLFIAILTLITVFFVIYNRSYKNLITPANNVKTNELLKPFDPNMDTSIIKEINERQKANE
jgi:hypothetical protein